MNYAIKILLIMSITNCYLIDITIGTLYNHNFKELRSRVKAMFDHAYNGYLEHAYPLDELQPLTCDGHDTWGSFSLTLVDSLDTLVVMGNYSEFRRAVTLLMKSLDFNKDVNVSVFETNIRVVGGLISAHLLSRRAGVKLEEGWPCEGPLLRLAEEFARKLLPAFDTPTGMPYGTVNLRHGVPVNETTVTCTAGVTTFILEMGALTHLTGDPIFESVALKSLHAMWKFRSTIGLVGNHIDIRTGKWTALDAGIGAGVDSYFEYLAKGSILFRMPELHAMFNEYRTSIERHVLHDDWHFWVHMEKGSVTQPIFQSLEAYWPGVLSLVGDLNGALKSLHNYHQVWKQYGFTPEFYSVTKEEPISKRSSYPLRPELIESIVYLYRATKDPTLLQMGVDILEAIETVAKTECGFATVNNVVTHELENRMESFFLAETTKYLYLLFDPDNFLHNNGDSFHMRKPKFNHQQTSSSDHLDCIIEAGGYIFNTEAHPIDPGALYCCSTQRQLDNEALSTMHDDDSLLRALDLNIDNINYDHESERSITKRGFNFPDVSQNRLSSLESLDALISYRVENDSALLTCPLQPFHHRFSIYGEIIQVANKDLV